MLGLRRIHWASIIPRLVERVALLLMNWTSYRTVLTVQQTLDVGPTLALAFSPFRGLFMSINIHQVALIIIIACNTRANKMRTRSRPAPPPPALPLRRLQGISKAALNYDHTARGRQGLRSRPCSQQRRALVRDQR